MAVMLSAQTKVHRLRSAKAELSMKHQDGVTYKTMQDLRAHGLSAQKIVDMPIERLTKLVGKVEGKLEVASTAICLSFNDDLPLAGQLPPPQGCVHEEDFAAIAREVFWQCPRSTLSAIGASRCRRLETFHRLSGVDT